MTSAEFVDEMNHASSPNRPNLYLVPKISLGNPQATDTKCGFTFWLGSINVEKPLRSARVKTRVVQAIDCMADDFLCFFLVEQNKCVCSLGVLFLLF